MSDSPATQALPPARVEQLRARLAHAPFARTLGGFQLLDAQRGRARIRLHVDTRHQQGGGIVQGGIIATLVDSTMAFAVMSLTTDDHPFVTIEMKVNFMAPVSEDDLVAEGWVIHEGGRTLVCECEVRDGRGKLIAKALSTLIRMKKG
ncbi:MAG: PaaI family thioesterase [Dehalococcoidia bacterium]|nr:PaaI family thioesterase [Dehalococcoidia bacterium]